MSAPWTIQARWLLPMDGPPIAGGTLTIAGDRIVSVDAPGQVAADHDLGDVILLPGLVNAHTHLDLGGLRELAERMRKPVDFTGWLREVVAHRRSSAPDEWTSAIRAGIAECVRQGTTLVGDIASAGVSGPILAAAPIRAVAFYELIGLHQSRAEAALAQADDWLARQPRTATYRPGLSPHAPYTVSRYLLNEAVRRAREADLPLAMHFAETPHEADLLERRAGPLRSLLEELGAWHETDLFGGLLEVARAFDCYTGKALLVHGNYLETGSFPASPCPRVPASFPVPSATVVYCPRTHACFGHPPHPVAKLLATGVNVALGTDSLASNPDLSILEEMRFMHQHRAEIPAEQIVRMGTLNGARALGWENETGSLTPGKSADWITVPIEGDPGSDPFALLLEGKSTPSHVCCRGTWRR